MAPGGGEVTRLLKQIRAGEGEAADRLASLVYDELRKLAASRLRRERNEHTLSATALANEAWLRFGDDIPEQDIENRRHFYAIVARTMRRILVEHARARNASKRGGEITFLNVEAIDIAAADGDNVEAVDAALTRLAAIRPRAAQVVELRFFGGFTHHDIAQSLAIDRRTVDRDWEFARAWLFGELTSGSRP